MANSRGANRLGEAVSPYLLSHADNPVDWWPWGEDAFAEARRRDVPVMVSIGYATCHWCHVMARETFSDPEIAEYLNDELVAIKVDREEHPEVDAAYLAAASAFTPNLGWPLTVFTTPEGLTFYAGTYYPPRPVHGVPSFRQVVDAVLEAWHDKRDDVQSAGAMVRDAVVQSRAAGAAGGGASALDAALGGEGFDGAVQRLLSLEDPEFGDEFQVRVVSSVEADPSRRREASYLKGVLLEAGLARAIEDQLTADPRTAVRIVHTRAVR